MSHSGDKSWVQSVSRYVETPMRAFQVYLGSGHNKAIPRCNPKDIIAAREILNRHQKYFVIHASLLYNPCGSAQWTDDPHFDKKWKSTLVALTAELDIAAGFGTGVVLHVGSCKHRGKGISKVVETLERVLSTVTSVTEALAKEEGITPKAFILRRRVFLENAAGEKTKLGSTLEEIAKIINELRRPYREQVKVCIDTAHLCGAGDYNVGIPENLDRFYSDFDELLGLEKLELFHLNDSKVPFGAHRDLHAGLGKGYLFHDNETGLRYFFQQAREHGIPMIGEPPDDGMDCWNYVHDNIVELYS